MRWVLGYISGFCVLLMIITQSISFFAFYFPIYRRGFERWQTAAAIGIDDDELEEAAVGILAYLRRGGYLETLTVTIGGAEREFLNQPEREHLSEVRDFFGVMNMVRNVAFWLFLMTAAVMALCKYPLLFVLFRSLRELIVGFLLVLLILAVVMAFAFDGMFDTLHLILFNNDIWHAEADLLALVLPREFFLRISIYIMSAWAVVSGILLAIVSVYLRRALSMPGFGGIR